jgi:UDP-3-O-[3-hydroxymyristoyl] glucosamine N-acyltransferase
MSLHREGKTVNDLAAHVGGRVRGDGRVLIKSVASVESAAEGEIAFVEDSKLFESACSSNASCLIVPEGAQVDAPCLIEVIRPKLAFALVAELLHPPKRRAGGRHPTAIIAESASVDESAFVGARVEIAAGASVGAGTQVLSGAFVGERVRLGRDCVIHPNVVLYDNVTLGDRVILHAGVIVGADGFGYVPDAENVRHKFPQIGTVVIEDDVEIGAATCVDRGALGETRIGSATKIDNLVQVAHNVRIGSRVVIAAQTGISGSTVIEDDAVIGSKAGVLPGKIVRAGVWWGIPVQPLDQYKRLNAHLNRLPQLREEVKELRRRLEELIEKMQSEQ